MSVTIAATFVLDSLHLHTNPPNHLAQCDLAPTFRATWPKAYALQKTAYRRANGGSGAPGMHDEVAAKFVSQVSFAVAGGGLRRHGEGWFGFYPLRHCTMLSCKPRYTQNSPT